MSCIWKLRSHDKSPPSGFYYEQTEGIYKRFGGQVTPKDLARTVADFRAGNGLPRADKASALEDIDCYTCARLGFNNDWCYDTTGQSYAQTVAAILPAPCPGCGAKV